MSTKRKRFYADSWYSWNGWIRYWTSVSRNLK